MLLKSWESAHPTSAHHWLRPCPRPRPKTLRRPAQLRGTMGQEHVRGLEYPRAGGPSTPVMCKQTRDQQEAAETLRPQRGPLSRLSTSSRVLTGRAASTPFPSL